MGSSGETVRLADWLQSRVPPPPPSLAALLSRVAGDKWSAEVMLYDELATLARDILASIGEDRASAGDLLAADALISYAMEAAAEECTDVNAAALRVIAIVGQA
ncbi:MAG: hypothetical protein ABIS03_13560 [Gemmatimonadaceae bacterium]